jgi:hypothetical protein
MELKVLNKQGQSVKAIARISGAARNTVRKYVRDGAKAQRKPRASRLDAYRDWLIARLLQSPGIPASVLRRELEERGCVMGAARNAGGALGYHGLFRRSLRALAARYERKHQWLDSPISTQRHRFVGSRSGLLESSRACSQYASTGRSGLSQPNRSIFSHHWLLSSAIWCCT